MIYLMELLNVLKNVKYLDIHYYYFIISQVFAHSKNSSSYLSKSRSIFSCGVNSNTFYGTSICRQRESLSVHPCAQQ